MRSPLFDSSDFQESYNNITKNEKQTTVLGHDGSLHETTRLCTPNLMIAACVDRRELREQKLRKPAITVHRVSKSCQAACCTGS